MSANIKIQKYKFQGERKTADFSIADNMGNEEEDMLY